MSDPKDIRSLETLRGLLEKLETKPKARALVLAWIEELETKTEEKPNV